MGLMKKERGPTRKGSPKEPAGTVSPIAAKLRRAIAEGFGEYRRLIHWIRGKHGFRARRSLDELN